MVLATLKQHELPPELLNLELNEKLLNQLPRNFERSLNRLGELGVSLTLDNFGSGSSPLEYFQRFRFDRLKIHQSLVRKIGDQSVSASVLSGIVAMARKMGVQIVAEGVERSEQRERLLAEGCEVGQGFLFGRPMSEEALTERVNRRRETAEPTDDIPAPEPIQDDAQTGNDDSLEEESSSPQEHAPLPTKDAFDEPHEDSPRAPVELLPSIPPELSGDLPEISVPQTPLEETPSNLDAVRSESSDRIAIPAQFVAETITQQQGEPEETHTEARELGRYTAPAPGKRASQWRIHGVLAIVALVIWGFNLWPEAIQSVPPTKAEVPVQSQDTEANALTQSPATADGSDLAPTLQDISPTATPAVSPHQLIEVAQAWAKAWSEQRVDAYLELYARRFEPSGELSRDEWSAQRRVRIQRPKKIDVQLGTIEAELIDSERGRVSFDQRYTSDNYSDSVRKTLELIQEDGTWKILMERSG